MIDDDESVGRSLARFIKAFGFRSVSYRSSSAGEDTPKILKTYCTHAVDGNPLENIDLVADAENNFLIIMKAGMLFKNTLD